MPMIMQTVMALGVIPFQPCQQSAVMVAQLANIVGLVWLHYELIQEPGKGRRSVHDSLPFQTPIAMLSDDVAGAKYRLASDSRPGPSNVALFSPAAEIAAGVLGM